MIGLTQACTKVYTRSINSSRVLLQDICLKEATRVIVIRLLSVSLFPWKTVICVRGRHSGGGGGGGGERREGERDRRRGERRLVREGDGRQLHRGIGGGIYV